MANFESAKLLEALRSRTKSLPGSFKASRRAFAFIGLCLVLLGTWLALRTKYDADKTPASFSVVEQFEKEGVPVIEGVAFDGGPFTSTAQIKAPVLIINFWASWCDPCVQEFPSMVKLVQKMNGKVHVVAVSQDEDMADMQTFLRLFQVPKPGFSLIWDRSRSIGTQFGVTKLPESFIVGPDRKLVRKVLGVEDWSSEPALRYFSDLAHSGSGKKK